MRRNGFAEGPVCVLLCNSPPSDLLTIFLVFPNAVNMLLLPVFIRERKKKKEKEMYARVFFSILYYYYCYYFARPSLTACSTVFAIERKYTSNESNKSAMEIMLKRRPYRLSHIYTHSLTGSLRQPWKFFFFLFWWPFRCDGIYNAKI